MRSSAPPATRVSHPDRGSPCPTNSTSSSPAPAPAASARPSALGSTGLAARHEAFGTELIELADFALPVYNEPKHPRLQDYAHEHTKRWSASVDAADAFIFVTPEYNHFPTPALVNALDYVYSEWNYKPCAFVSYGGVSGGLRAVEAVRPLVDTVKLVPILEAVVVPFVGQQLKDGVFEPVELQTESANLMLTELARWTDALKPLRGA